MWTGPDRPQPPPGYSPPPLLAANPARSVWWRIGHSLWILAPALSFGCLSAAGFLYVGIRARRPAWWLAGIGYSLAAITLGSVGPALPEDSPASGACALGLLALWIASIVHALVINTSWLRWRAMYVPWHAQPTVWVGPTAPPPSAPLPGPLQGMAPPPGQFYATRPGPAPAAMGAAGPPQPSPAAGPPQPAATGPGPLPDPPTGPLDVNTATVQQLSVLPGFDDDRAAYVIAERRRRGGFVHVNEFAAAAALAPHELVAVRDRIVCGPTGPSASPEQAPQFGRVLDV